MVIIKKENNLSRS